VKRIVGYTLLLKTPIGWQRVKHTATIAEAVAEMVATPGTGAREWHIRTRYEEPKNGTLSTDRHTDVG
jgi:hypothetical protein